MYSSPLTSHCMQLCQSALRAIMSLTNLVPVCSIFVGVPLIQKFTLTGWSFKSCRNAKVVITLKHSLVHWRPIQFISLRHRPSLMLGLPLCQLFVHLSFLDYPASRNTVNIYHASFIKWSHKCFKKMQDFINSMLKIEFVSHANSLTNEDNWLSIKKKSQWAW